MGTCPHATNWLYITNVKFSTIFNSQTAISTLEKAKKDVMAQQDFDALIQQLGLESVMNQLPSEISGGQKQRVAIAKAIYTNPDIILADEPTASLDTENAMSVMEILKNESKRRNKMCMIVTHDERLTAYCDKVFEMKDGVLTEK
ncbi:ATP-binding cassette domain-containing protein [Staphylococcus pseudintermedius]|nr:ATP-binding cassette domain-containing protein [Staphylococcus pseudintermedius]USO09986.1 ATP-binding cassette domain-containing protein [Staphylococcus pseudintermedius]USO11441.1 ATP-binding cassette domain-containing protein [Staphylococcus pseudintermedius]USO12997.1 ATP-binding cassette domain-containing protein [Staphylococcus pseudintermedius]USO15717.1 ATP-binding cassette domain-containing protein [Staphylococcus pseudintermedius]